jgi:hypothetical protein
MFNLFNKNKYSKHSKTKNVSDDNFIGFKDLKGATFILKDRDSHLIIGINNEKCYFDREQIKVLIEMLKYFAQGKSIKSLTNILDERKEGK